jgi:hypothetical protein
MIVAAFSLPPVQKSVESSLGCPAALTLGVQVLFKTWHHSCGDYDGNKASLLLNSDEYFDSK